VPLRRYSDVNFSESPAGLIDLTRMLHHALWIQWHGFRLLRFECAWILGLNQAMFMLLQGFQKSATKQAPQRNGVTTTTQNMQQHKCACRNDVMTVYYYESERV
jgi:hypothetical protein